MSDRVDTGIVRERRRGAIMELTSRDDKDNGRIDVIGIAFDKWMLGVYCMDWIKD